MSKENGYVVHEGPMADKRGTGWRQDAAKLEAQDQRRQENPMQTMPSTVSAIDKAHAARGKSDGGTVDKDDVMAEGGDTIQGEG